MTMKEEEYRGIEGIIKINDNHYIPNNITHFKEIKYI